MLKSKNLLYFDFNWLVVWLCGQENQDFVKDMKPFPQFSTLITPVNFVGFIFNFTRCIIHSAHGWLIDVAVHRRTMNNATFHLMSHTTKDCPVVLS